MQGPRKMVIPAREEWRCDGCEYHKVVTQFCARSGEGSWTEWGCDHPEVRGALGRTNVTPEWCPFLLDRLSQESTETLP